jgi:glycosyltransferase involved in cell wall biosynthesis
MNLANGHTNFPAATLDLSVVAPAHNEEDNVAQLAQEVHDAIAPTGLSFEFVVIDDGSTDHTRERLAALMPERPWLRCVGMVGTPPGKGNGQSAAFHAGFRACRGELIAVLDADRQNDPADLRAMLKLLGESNADVVQGDRSHARKDNIVRKVGSVVGRLVRRALLGDTVRDTGCSLRLMKREVALALPLEFKGIHRFIPAMARDLGFRVVEMPVHHRPRTAGETKYGFGITQRALPGLIDCLAVRWMRTRRRQVDSQEVASSGAAGSSVGQGGAVVKAAEGEASGADVSHHATQRAGT